MGTLTLLEALNKAGQHLNSLNCSCPLHPLPQTGWNHKELREAVAASELQAPLQARLRLIACAKQCLPKGLDPGGPVEGGQMPPALNSESLALCTLLPVECPSQPPVARPVCLFFFTSQRVPRTSRQMGGDKKQSGFY